MVHTVPTVTTTKSLSLSLASFYLPGPYDMFQYPAGTGFLSIAGQTNDILYCNAFREEWIQLSKIVHSSKHISNLWQQANDFHIIFIDSNFSVYSHLSVHFGNTYIFCFCQVFYYFLLVSQKRGTHLLGDFDELRQIHPKPLLCRVGVTTAGGEPGPSRAFGQPVSPKNLGVWTAKGPGTKWYHKVDQIPLEEFCDFLCWREAGNHSIYVDQLFTFCILFMIWRWLVRLDINPHAADKWRQHEATGIE